MFIIQLVVILAVIGLLLWLVNTYIPMAEPIKRIINIIVIVAIILWLLNVFGIFDMGGSGYRFGHGHRL
jgi:hypothetical protein